MAGPVSTVAHQWAMANHITFLGDQCYTGAYVLWIRVATGLRLAFGRFQGGRPVNVPAGAYAYVGSAMGRRGAPALAGRLLRHATRTSDKPPQAIRAAMLDQFAAAGLATGTLRPPATKRLHWHIDYLLDEMAVVIEEVTVVRTAARVESRLARGLAAAQGSAPLAPGLGASDMPGETYLLRLPDESLDWRGRVASILGPQYAIPRHEF